MFEWVRGTVVLGWNLRVGRERLKGRGEKRERKEIRGRNLNIKRNDKVESLQLALSR